jgi:hypothetical protein
MQLQSLLAATQAQTAGSSSVPQPYGGSGERSGSHTPQPQSYASPPHQQQQQPHRLSPRPDPPPSHTPPTIQQVQLQQAWKAYVTQAQGQLFGMDALL